MPTPHGLPASARLLPPFSALPPCGRAARRRSSPCSSFSAQLGPRRPPHRLRHLTSCSFYSREPDRRDHRYRRPTCRERAETDPVEQPAPERRAGQEPETPRGVVNPVTDSKRVTAREGRDV